MRVVDGATPDVFPRYVCLAIRVMWATGCRPAEVVGRAGRPGREEPYQSRIKPHHGIRGVDVLPGHKLYVEGKNTRPDRRTTRLKPRVVLCAGPDVWQELRDLADAANDKEANLLLPTSTNGVNTLRWHIVKLKDMLPGRLQGFSPRWLRHSHAIHAIRAGVDLVSVQRQLGHERLDTTAIYLRYAGLHEERYLEAFGALHKREQRDCPACGFEWEVDTRTGEPTWEARMGAAMRRRG